ncbi:BsaA family SipW-dependent biofilm matrix protein [Clostridium sardiniense]|uniref:BsaA family SipW-dependent biofilm matrix protein n=1 Tax=Clostridium sardiniense TaxID=29369 RepID=A0ABS7L2H9_CLOSR|nr:BsaA family SipW-dependent biofilm matrix protein [Clostridium sardiniense]MBM7833798.1 alternate signal-mediated exported protein [Clostridium sardiniense]MBY0757280.1 BsaA family SipW-dependent biofilm matrix protein [Clostridium sardiniense]MDQ0461604.1 alternate signal-mediated exported protein [Clostridium sardiniense]
MKKVGLTLGIILLFTTTVASLAYFSSKESKKNKFTIGSISTEINENFDKDSAKDVSRNEEIKKVVSIKNTGKNPVIVRVIINPQWDEEKDENGKVTKLTTSASNQVQLNFSNTWKEDWIKDNDGYYYYNKILNPGESTSDLLKSISLKNNISQEDIESFKNRNFSVNVSSEAIQVNKEALRKEWNINNTISDKTMDKLDEIIDGYVK